MHQPAVRSRAAEYGQELHLWAGLIMDRRQAGGPAAGVAMVSPAAPAKISETTLGPRIVAEDDVEPPPMTSTGSDLLEETPE